MKKYLYELNIGDKFWFEDRPYLIIDFDLTNQSLFTDFSDMRCVLCLNSYKIVVINKNKEVMWDKDNFYV